MIGRSLPLLAALVAVILGAICAPVFAFRTVPSIEIKKASLTTTNHHLNNNCVNQRRHQITQLHMSDEIPNNNSQEKEMDPLIASLTRIDEGTPTNVPTRQVPLFGEVPADGNLALLVPAAAIGILGFIFSIVVAFSSRDAIVKEFSQVELPKMEYTPTKVVEGECRGLCSSQDEDLDGLRNFMEGISNRKVQDL